MTVCESFDMDRTTSILRYFTFGTDMPVILWDTLVIEDLTVFWNKLIFVKKFVEKIKKLFFIWKYKFVRSGSDLWEMKEDGLIFITGYFRKKEF